MLAVVLVIGGAAFMSSVPAAFPIPKANVNVTPVGVPYQQLTTGGWDDVDPEWSPNGSLIAFVSDRNGTWGIFTMSPNGTTQERLTSTTVTATNISWSPDSSSIAYWLYDDGRTSIEVVRLSDLSTFQVSENGSEVAQAPAVWSPDGSRLLYYDFNPAAQLVCSDLTTMSSRVLANVNGSDISASWIADDEITYSNLNDGLYEVMWLNLTSGAGGPLISGSSNYLGGAVNPNGTRIAYYSDQQVPLRGNDIFEFSGYNVWSSQIFPRTSDAYLYSRMGENTPYRPGVVVMSSQLQFSPDGNLLACVLDNPVFGTGVYVWNYIDQTVVNVGPTGGEALNPTWAPDSTTVAFSCNESGSFHIWSAAISGLVNMPPPAY